MKNIAKARFWAVRQVDSHTVEIVALADRRDDLKGQVARAIVTGKVEAAEVTFLCLLEGVSLCPDGNIYFDDEEFVASQDPGKEFVLSHGYEEG